MYRLKLIFLVAIKSKALSAIWTFPSILFSAIMIAWGAESAQFLVSQGLILAIISWLQTAPEFVVEGIIAWNQNITLMTANFTGATRLLIGFGLPTVYLTAFIFNLKKKHGAKKYLTKVKLEPQNSIPVMGFLIPSLYAIFIVIKGSLHIGDSAILIFIYLVYLYILNKMPPQEVESLEEMEPIPRFVLKQKKPVRNLLILGFFLTGGVTLYLVAHPFVESMLALAVYIGVSEYFFVQWVAPFLSEFPEFVSASYWARTVKKAPMATMNTVSSVISELTLLVALIPIVYSISKGAPTVIHFDHLHRAEILLTAMQALLGFLLLVNMEYRWYEALGLFSLWFIQFVVPHIREEIILVYAGWILLEIILAILGRRKWWAFKIFWGLMKKHF
ncbi:MAG: hypothetical protein A2V73_06435 [candidate division Zixibacteria bacterium RBG_19FT_COMBO_42_43]|nr:MAG: hypothetical protein A2V73_06435 [candidate division Zixibacteria bacterium RBG_19FT_COMBO_42_43]